MTGMRVIEAMMKSAAPSLIVALILLGCDGQTSMKSMGAPSVSDANRQHSDGAIDRGVDLAVSDGTVPDATVTRCPDAAACLARERLVDCQCVHINNRICVTDEDCRTSESCIDAGRGVLYCYQPDPPVEVCPGNGCQSGQVETELLGAARSKVITPLGFEVPTELGYSNGRLTAWPLEDPAHWLDCGLDSLCPGDEGYMEADLGEGDGAMQGMWLAGFRHGRPASFCPMDRVGCDEPECCVSRFAHDDLKVQIIVIRQGGVTVAFTAIDTVGFFHSDIEKIQKRVKPLGVDLLVMGATHNHEAPDTSGQWGPGVGLPQETGRDARLMRRIEEQTVAGISEAMGALEPIELRAGVIDTGVEGLGISDSRSPYIFNDDLPIVQLVSKASNQAIGTMLSFGNHAEVLWSNNRLITADYPHFVRKYVRDGLGERVHVKSGVTLPALGGTGGVIAFFAGSVGGLINPGGGSILDYAGNEPAQRHSFAAADAIGQRLASKVLIALNDNRISTLDTSTKPLRFATKRYLVPAENDQLRLAAQILDLIRRDVYNVAVVGGANFPGLPYIMSQVAVVSLGGLTFFTAPGEAFPETLCGGYPNRPSTHTPVLGDVAERQTPAECNEGGLPEAGGSYPCLINPDAENPPDWASAPEAPYLYDRVPGDTLFLIGLGMDFLGYLVPEYDFKPAVFGREAPGNHYEESNSLGIESTRLWRRSLSQVIESLGLLQP